MSAIRYFATLGSGTLGKLDPQDDPKSDLFLPLAQRSPMQQIRWWARRGRQQDNRPPTGVFDEPANTSGTK